MSDDKNSTGAAPESGSANAPVRVRVKLGGKPEETAVADPVASPVPPVSDEDLQAIERLKAAYTAIKGELSKVIVGQDAVIDQVLIAIFTRSHALLVGVPGLAKTLLISTLAQTMHLTFKRIQFTPDLMPSDITGTEVIYQNPVTGERTFKFLQGPIFANVVLADEINRTPPKTQAAMLEAMQERKVSVGGVDHKLPSPFFVLATQNPIEQEGTYPLPEAQLDRFMFLIMVDYPSTAEELQIMKMATSVVETKLEAVLSAEDILQLQQVVRRMPVADHVYAYAERIVRVTRIKQPEALDFCKKWLTWGAGPRASLNLIMAAKARAMLNGQNYVSCEDVAAVALPIMRHRIAPNFAAQSEGVTTDDITRKILETVPQHQKLA
ncbi:MAG: MoxR family ATPase [Verrucomicrobiota bacterium]